MASYLPPYRFNWQNPELCETIYPFRLEKLRDVLLYYMEADLWKNAQGQPVNPQTSLEIIQEISRLNLELSAAKQLLADTKQAVKTLEARNKEFQRNREIRIIDINRINLKTRLEGQRSRARVLKGSVDWHQNYAKQHPEVLTTPYYLRRLESYQAAEAECTATQQLIDQANLSYQAELEKVGLGAFDQERSALLEKVTATELGIQRLNDELLKLPKLGKNGEVTQGAAVKWTVIKFERSQRDLSQADLLKSILARFDSEPERYPQWLRYMIIHFSGMRYKSAHASWASGRDLLQSVREGMIEVEIKKLTAEELAAESEAAIAALQTANQAVIGPTEANRITNQVALLTNSTTRPGALIKYRSLKLDEEMKTIDEAQALNQLRSMKDQFPAWAWKEMVARTELRLEFAEDNWEDLTPEEQKQRWQRENAHWREIMDAWEQKDITAWRSQHAQTLNLVVTRAVCNEIAEHIQHLRGRKPFAGLTAKPKYYLREQNKKSNQAQTQPAKKAFLHVPGQQSKDSFLPGASILWLGWTDRRPNAWQIAEPIPGILVTPPHDTSTAQSWTYANPSGSFTRSSRQDTGERKGGGNQSERRQPRQYSAVTNWLRWTHEATVVDLLTLSDGRDYVLTFETGQIGLRLRPLGELLNSPYVYLGYVPEGSETDLSGLKPMLEPTAILPEGVLAGPREFGAPKPGKREAPPSDLVDKWKLLTPREKQVVTLICREISTRKIAKQMEISPSTVKFHLQNAMKKFGVHSRQELRRELARRRKAGA